MAARETQLDKAGMWSEPTSRAPARDGTGGLLIPAEHGVRDSPGRPWAPPVSELAIDHRLHSNRQRTSTERPSKSIDANVDEVSNPSSSATLLACESWLSDLEPLPLHVAIGSRHAALARCATASTGASLPRSRLSR